MKTKAEQKIVTKSKTATLAEERRKDQTQIDFRKRRRGCDMTFLHCTGSK